MIKQVKKWWEQNSESYQTESKIPIDIHYCPGAPHEKKLRLLGNLKGKTVLEIGCGGAQCGIAMAKEGAKITGIDLSEKQLELARTLSKKHKTDIKFIQGDITNLSMIKSDSQDIVFSAWAFQYLSEKQLVSCFKEVKRVLKKGGIFVFSLEHPFYDIFDKTNAKFNRSYYKRGVFRAKHAKGVWTGYTRTVGDLVNTIINSRLIIEKMLE